MLNVIIKLYGKLHARKGIPYWLFSPLRRTIRFIANIFFPFLLKNKYCRKSKNVTQTEIIVSLTSFPSRINEVWQVIEIMKRQTYKPKKIFLWLSKEQFPLKNALPGSLLNQEDEMFSIKFVDNNIRSHKKYYYVSQSCPNADVLLIDDDIYYPTDMIERMIAARRDNPNAIICQYGYIIKYDENNVLMQYNKWENVTQYSNDNKLFFGSGGGTLFKPSELYKDLTNQELFLQLTPTADDIWLNAMARLANVPIIMLKPALPLPVKIHGQKEALSKINVGLGKNDEQIKAVSDYYKRSVNKDPFERVN